MGGSRLRNVTFNILDSRLTLREEKNADHGTPASLKLFRPIWLQTYGENLSKKREEMQVMSTMRT